MKKNHLFSRRRAFVAGNVGLALSLLTARLAKAATEPAALDTSALAVKVVKHVLLIAIALTPGGRLVAVGVHGVVIYSDDNGANWVQANVPVNVTLTCIAFATAEIGWVAGHFGVILKTQDGGKNWSKQLNGDQVNELAMKAAQDSLLTMSASPAAPTALRRANHFLGNGPENPFLTMIVFNPLKLLVLGAYRMAVMTNDGGKTWQDWSLHIYDKYSHNIYGSTYINGAYVIVAEEGLIFRSNDAGATFLPLTPPGSTTIFGVLSAKDCSLVVYGVAGFVSRSTDMGNTWTTSTIATQQDLTGGRVLVSGDIVLVDEAGLLLESTDNGITFSNVQGIQPEPFFDVQQAPSGGLIAVGASGVTQIAKSLLAS